jgi:hypothetical protein
VLSLGQGNLDFGSTVAEIRHDLYSLRFPRLYGEQIVHCDPLLPSTYFGQRLSKKGQLRGNLLDHLAGGDRQGSAGREGAGGSAGNRSHSGRALGSKSNAIELIGTMHDHDQSAHWRRIRLAVASCSKSTAPRMQVQLLSGGEQTSLPKWRRCRHVITYLFSSGYAPG